MLLNWEMNRMNGPRFLPSGKRLGPYFCKRVEASPVSRPFTMLVSSRLSTSSTAKACQGVGPAADLGFPAASISLLLPVRFAVKRVCSTPRGVLGCPLERLHRVLLALHIRQVDFTDSNT